MPYEAFKHTHTLLVTLFILSMLIKTIMLLMNKDQALDNYRKKMMVPEMIIATLFLALGIYMLIAASLYVQLWFWIKIVAVLATIPIGIVAFRKKNKAMGVVTLLILLFILIYAFIR